MARRASQRIARKVRFFATFRGCAARAGVLQCRHDLLVSHQPAASGTALRHAANERAIARAIYRRLAGTAFAGEVVGQRAA
jgi:hypothetical protein